MNKKMFPALSIAIVALILLAFNHFTNSNLIRDYALVFIIAGMFFGMWLTRYFDKNKDE